VTGQKVKAMLNYYSLFLVAILALSCTGTKLIRPVDGKTPIASMEKISLGGFDQFILIRGEDTSNPVLLFLHGGPGAAETALFRKFNGSLEEFFTVVYWDQRGAGKSYSKTIDPATITLRQNLADINELVNHLKQRFRVDKIFLVGHSWGSKLGMYAINQHPSDFYAFVGVGQEVASFEGELQSYQFTLEKARQKNHAKAVLELVEMGAPKNDNYTTMYKTGFWGIVRQKKWLLKFGGERYKKTGYLDWIMTIWLSREYSFGDLFRWKKGSAFTAGQMLKDPDFQQFDFRREIPHVEVPVFFVAGLHDFNTPWPLVREYYRQIKAPVKNLYLFEKSGHSPPFEEPDRFNDLLVKILLPMAE
jgi:proline iminopeptidase